MKEERLIMLLRSDPNKGMKKVIDAYSGLVFSIVRGRLSGFCGSAEIEDCAAEVFIRFNSALDGLRTDGSVRNYLAVIARNTSSNYLRSKSSEAAVDGEDALLEIPDGTDVCDEAYKKQLVDSIMEEIRKMGHPDSDIVIRKYYFNHRSADIARDLGLTTSNVDVRSHRALKKLQAKFGGKDENQY